MVNQIGADPLENLLPSLVQCFGIILIGYLANRCSFINKDNQALGQYVTKFALPALFFRSMASINFSDVDWLFIVAVSLAKFSLFLITVILVMVMTRPVNLGMAGILSMFVTQSNDVALAYPILKAIYPDLADYIYLFAPAQLVLINPLCFVLLEWHEYRIANVNANIAKPVPAKRRALLVLRKVLLNPLVFMTVVGVAANFAVGHQLPRVVDRLLQILADSFAGVALFYLGMSMHGKANKLDAHAGFLLTLILLGKLIFMPFLTRELVLHLVGLNKSVNESLKYSTVGFIYGGMPTAPPVFLIASTFQILPDLIATGLVMCTFLSGPLMFVAARVATMMITQKSQYDHILQNTAVSISALSIVSCIWVIVVLVIGRKWRSPTHKLTMTYIFFVLLTCLGLVVGRIMLTDTLANPKSSPSWGHYVQFSIFFIGTTGARIWTAVIALSIAILKRRSVCFLVSITKHIYLVAICIPIFVTSMLLIFSTKQKLADIDPSFQYGRAQIITSLVILALSIVVTITSLVLQTRFHFSHNSESKSESQTTLRDPCSHVDESDEDDEIGRDSRDVEESSMSFLCPAGHGSCSNEQRLRCKRGMARIIFNGSSRSSDCNSSLSTTSPTDNNVASIEEELQLNKHIILCIILLVTMSFGLFLCLWRLINEEVSGIYIELEFLDCSFNFGQGFIVWSIFGFDIKLILVPFKHLLKIWRRINEFYIPPEGHLAPEVTRIREQFVSKHLASCRRDLEMDHKHNSKWLYGVFSGTSLIDWLLLQSEVNLIRRDRLAAHNHAQSLLIGRVVECVHNQCNLLDDKDTFYRFTVSAHNNDTT